MNASPRHVLIKIPTHQTTGDDPEEEAEEEDDAMTVIEETPVMRCAVPACRRVIEPGSEYYPLAAGTVNTCDTCATANGRGWDKVRGMKKVYVSVK